MPQVRHVERHFTGSDTVRDIVIGMADGLTVPFALAAGLSGVTAQTHIIVTAGLAEIAAGAISMGLGGYLAGRSDAEHYDSERRREEQEVREVPKQEQAEVAQILQSYGLDRQESAAAAGALSQRPKQWVDFMMRFELGMEEPARKRALTSALTIAAAYIVGGLVPLAPYFGHTAVSSAVLLSSVLTLIALAAFGYVKSRFTGARPLRSALQTALVGGLAAAAAFAIARFVI